MFCNNLKFEIFKPETDKEVPDGNLTQARATCLCCHAILTPERVLAQLTAQKGGADVVFDSQGNCIGGARLLAVVTLNPSPSGRGAKGEGRHYRLPAAQDY